VSSRSQAPDSRSAPASRGTVLLVEDERDTRELLAGAIERAGYRCVSAAGPGAALALCGQAGFVDVVVTDVVLGADDHGGLRLMAELRALGVLAPIVVITAYADVEKVKIALNQGAAYLLEKPFRAPQLIEVIEQVRTQGGDAHHAIHQVLTRASLTSKERTVALHLLDGLSSTEIAQLENNSPKTIRQHVSTIYAKCGVGSRAELFRLVFKPG
jgi:DNA-binding NarL/FixJ family response regulator